MLIRRDSTNCACGSGAVTRKIGSLAKKTVPSGMAWTSPVKRKAARQSMRFAPNRPVLLSHSISAPENCSDSRIVQGLFQPGGNEKAAPRRQVADEKLENGGFRRSMIQIGLHHVDLVEVGQ